MPPRAYWTGNLKLSLITMGVRLYNATTSAGRIQLHQVHKPCNSRLRFPPTCPVHGIVERDEIAKAYEFEKDQYVIIEKEDLDRIKLRTARTIELFQFVKAGEFDPLYLDSPYFLAPDGPLAHEAFAVIRDAIRGTQTLGIGRVALSGKEHLVALRAEGKGLVLSTVRAAAEVRRAEDYFQEVQETAVEGDQLDMVEALIRAKTARFRPEEFQDRYQEALRKIVKAKVAGQEPVTIHEEEVARSYNFMEALKRSLDEAGAAKGRPKKKLKKPPAKSLPAAKRRKKRA